MKIEHGAYGLFYAHDETLLPGSMIVGETEKEAQTRFHRACAAVENGYASTPGIIENHSLSFYAHLDSYVFLPNLKGMTRKQIKEASKIAETLYLSVVPSQGHA
ncbi:MAG: hypothetical protein JWN64_204 [Parcubacteria group bacterium]|nr:hypothetical protein [Parcubacteria group bacterium]